jgi:hypothetical protein
VSLALVAAACVPGDSDGNGGLGSAIIAIAVVEGTVTEIDDGVVRVGNPAMIADLQNSRLADWTDKLEQLLASLPEQETLALRFSQGRFAKGSRYAFFVGALVINDQWDEDFSVLYAHDLATDTPTSPWNRFKSGIGRQTAEVLQCIENAFNTSGERSGLDALIQASIESNQLQGSQETAIQRCAIG